jgi:hypothetical protein
MWNENELAGNIGNKTSFFMGTPTHQSANVATSITKRYLMSLFSIRS